jgi:hypothetical protein
MTVFGHLSSGLPRRPGNDGAVKNPDTSDLRIDGLLSETWQRTRKPAFQRATNPSNSSTFDSIFDLQFLPWAGLGSFDVLSAKSRFHRFHACVSCFKSSG